MCLSRRSLRLLQLHLKYRRSSLYFVSSPCFSSFSKESITTEVAPIVNHGPFGSGGTVVGFSKHEGVRAAFEENFARRLELGAQLVVYEKGEKIIDLYGYAPETVTEPHNNNNDENNATTGYYDGDTLQCVFSSGKNMEAIAMAMLVDRGLVAYEDLVTTHWPEFGANGKDNITIADVMRHAGGVPFVLDPDHPYETLTITPEDVIRVAPLEHKMCAAPRFPPPTSCGAPAKMAYHAHTRGWIVSGILRRADPAGRSLGRFLREEVTDPLSKSQAGEHEHGEVTFFCGIPKEDQPNYHFADIQVGFLPYRMMTELIPALAGYGDKPTAEFAKLFLQRSDLRRPVVSWLNLVPPPSFDFENSHEGRSIESPSAGMMANARSMALINAAAMAGDGSIHGVRLLSPEGVSHSMGDIVTQQDTIFDLWFGLSRGGYGSFKHVWQKDGGAEDSSYHTRMFLPDDEIAFGNFIGWGGFGGSLSMVDRERDISFAYCMNATGLNLLTGRVGYSWHCKRPWQQNRRK
eukprot:CAMPEP_0170967818 /NCGR_PEP_ID=MMETSP0735-20130129/42868_1 /TAXON_ID=186038 /ORGANISM="Fragilariopsis kerguelensis, Strain L26-C5" /LENGTH=518 /DNA_ID=CAMNT_0011386687 /DNA_START=175 /DNA_END=1731 /DNA_ORIENTATION=+